jgi:hypothetical protein
MKHRLASPGISTLPKQPSVFLLPHTKVVPAFVYFYERNSLLNRESGVRSDPSSQLIQIHEAGDLAVNARDWLGN